MGRTDDLMSTRARLCSVWRTLNDYPADGPIGGHLQNVRDEVERAIAEIDRAPRSDPSPDEVLAYGHPHEEAALGHARTARLAIGRGMPCDEVDDELERLIGPNARLRDLMAQIGPVLRELNAAITELEAIAGLDGLYDE